MGSVQQALTEASQDHVDDLVICQKDSLKNIYICNRYGMQHKQCCENTKKQRELSSEHTFKCSSVDRDVSVLSAMAACPISSSGRPGKVTPRVCEILDSWADISEGARPT